MSFHAAEKGDHMAEKVRYMAYGKNVVTVRVVSYEDRRPVGTLSGPQMPEPLRFSSMAQLLFCMDELMDRENSPQRETEAREFCPVEPQPALLSQPKRERNLAVFEIRVLFRQNASWQGSLFWRERKLEGHFRSVLELMRLMDSALLAE